MADTRLNIGNDNLCALVDLPTQTDSFCHAFEMFKYII